MSVIQQLSSKQLCFTVTSGRSGTKLLATLLREASGICAEHEPAPRFNYTMRSALAFPEAAGWWLLSEKLPAIAQQVGSRPIYVETSHLVCKGFIEPLLECGLRPAFIILSRPASDVARSLFRIGAIPERTGSGRLVLNSPAQSPFLPLSGWERMSDYQLCYWYAREIEHRQKHYRRMFDRLGIDWVDYSFDQLRDWNAFTAMNSFLWGSAVELDRLKFDRVLLHNQNPRERLTNGAAERALPADLEAQERQVEDRIDELAILASEPSSL